MFYVYILKSRKDGKLYIGSTPDLKRRFLEHNQGRVKSTKPRRPFIIAYYEAYLSEQEARKRENSLKLRGQTRRHLMARISKSVS